MHAVGQLPLRSTSGQLSVYIGQVDTVHRPHVLSAIFSVHKLLMLSKEKESSGVAPWHGTGADLGLTVGGA